MGPLAGVLLALLLAGFGAPLPEDLTLVGAGYLVWRGAAPAWLTFVVCWIGLLAGDVILYGIGRSLGARVMRLPGLRHEITPARFSRVSERLERRGGRAIVAGRLVPGARAALFFTSGIVRLPFARFLAWDALGATLSALLWISIGRGFGAHIDRVRALVTRAEHWLLLALAAAVFFALLSHLFLGRIAGPRRVV